MGCTIGIREFFRKGRDDKLQFFAQPIPDVILSEAGKWEAFFCEVEESVLLLRDYGSFDSASLRSG